MTAPRRILLVLVALGVGLAGANVMGRLTGAPPSTLTVESSSEDVDSRDIDESEPSLEAASEGPTSGTQTQLAACGAMAMTTRTYGRVVAGEFIEVLTPDAGQLILIDPTNSVRRFRVRAEHRSGQGELFFQFADGRSDSAVIGEDTYRSAQGWPRHWGLDAVVTGPGCWHLHIRGDGVDERIVFAIDRTQWRQAWKWSVDRPF